MREYLANHEDQEHNELEEEFEKDDLINLPSYENNERYRRWITIMKLIFAALAGLADFIIARMILVIYIYIYIYIYKVVKRDSRLYTGQRNGMAGASKFIY